MIDPALRVRIENEIVQTSAYAIDRMPITASMDDAIAMCIHADDIPVLRRAFELVGPLANTDRDDGVRRMHCLLPFGGGGQTFGLTFTPSPHLPAAIFAPKYARKSDIASVIPTAPRALSERLFIEGAKQFKVASQMALLTSVLTLFNEHTDLDQRSLVYHFPWLASIAALTLPRWKSSVDQAWDRWKEAGRANKKRCRADYDAKLKEYRAAQAFASLTPSAQHATTLPMSLRPYVQPTADAAAIFHVMKRTIASSTPPQTDIHVRFCARHLFSPVCGIISHSPLYGIGTFHDL